MKLLVILVTQWPKTIYFFFLFFELAVPVHQETKPSFTGPQLHSLSEGCNPSVREGRGLLWMFNYRRTHFEAHLCGGDRQNSLSQGCWNKGFSYLLAVGQRHPQFLSMRTSPAWQLVSSKPTKESFLAKLEVRKNFLTQSQKWQPFNIVIFQWLEREGLT